MRRTTFGNFFLTSKPYFGLDNDNFLQADFDILSGHLSFQPKDSGYITANATFFSLDVFGGSVAYTVYPEHWLTSTAEWSVLDIFGGGQTYDVDNGTPQDRSIKSLAYWNQLDVFGSGVAYDIEHHDLKSAVYFSTLDIF